MASQPPKDFDPDPWDTNYLDCNRDFRKYADEIERIIHNADRPLCTRDIHTALGENARREWTMDALETIRSIEAVGVLPTRYQKRSGYARLQSRSRESLHKIFAK